MKKELKKKLKEITKVAIKSEDDDSIIRAILELEKFKEFGESGLGIESTSDYEPTMKEIDEGFEYAGRLQEKMIWKLSPSALLAFHKRFEELEKLPIKSESAFMARGSFLDLRVKVAKRMGILVARGLCERE